MRYYKKGVGVEAYLVKVGEDYYFAQYKGVLIVDQKYRAFKTNCDLPIGWYTFGVDGKVIFDEEPEEPDQPDEPIEPEEKLNGIVEIDGVLRYYEDGVGVEKHLFYYEGAYYFAQYKGELVVNKTIRAFATNCDLPKDTYTFDAEGKMVGASPDGEIVEIDGELRYYKKGVGVEAYLVKVGEDYYFAQYKGVLIVDQKYRAFKTNCDLPIGWYTFGVDGKVIGSSADGEIVTINGELHYYRKGLGVHAGLICVDGRYYYAQENGKLAISQTIQATVTSCDLPLGTYTFDENGLLEGIIEVDGELYYYEDGKGAEKYLIKVDGAYYFAQSDGKLVRNQTIHAFATNCDLPVDTYTFGADGKMIGASDKGEIVSINGVLYYYENGVGVEAGLIKIGDYYYFAQSNGKLVVNEIFYAYKTSCDKKRGTYKFDENGRVIKSYTI